MRRREKRSTSENHEGTQKKIPCSVELSDPVRQGWQVSPELVQLQLPPQPGPSGRSGHALGARGKVGLGGQVELLVRHQLGAAARLAPAFWVRAELWASPSSPLLKASCLKYEQMGRQQSVR